MRRETIWGLVAATLLLAATLGVLQFEVAQGGGSAFRVSWATRDVPGPAASGRLTVGNSEAPIARVATENVTSVAFVLSWTDDIGDPDTFELSATSPSGDARTVEGATSPLVVTFDGLASVPADAHVLAASETAARERVGGAGSREAVGAWNVTVKLVAAPGRTVAGVEVQTDGANEWLLSTALTTYEPVVSRG